MTQCSIDQIYIFIFIQLTKRNEYTGHISIVLNNIFHPSITIVIIGIIHCVSQRTLLFLIFNFGFPNILWDGNHCLIPTITHKINKVHNLILLSRAYIYIRRILDFNLSGIYTTKINIHIFIFQPNVNILPLSAIYCCSTRFVKRHRNWIGVVIIHRNLGKYFFISTTTLINWDLEVFFDKLNLTLDSYWMLGKALESPPCA